MPAAATPPSTSSPPPVAALPTQPPTEQPRWTFLTNHAHVLVLLWQNPAMIVREVARQVGITERAVQHILAELENAGILQRTRVGRQNRYHIETSVPLRHPIESHRTIGELLQLCARTQHT
ncbi:MAG: helix-turn-helix transcriptional regulator [Planctomyces sp.]